MLNKEQKEKLKYYLSLNYPMVLTYEEEDRIYFVQFPDLPGCMAHGKTPTDAYKLAQKIKKEWLEDVLIAGKTIPEPKSENDYSGKFVVRIPSSLHKELSEQAEKAGRSLNQHVGFLLAERNSALSTENSSKRLEKAIDRLDAVQAQQRIDTTRLMEIMESQQKTVSRMLNLTKKSSWDQIRTQSEAGFNC